MKREFGPNKASAEQILKDIWRQPSRLCSAEEKIRVVLEELRGGENVSEFFRREGIATSIYRGWTKEVPQDWLEDRLAPVGGQRAYARVAFAARPKEGMQSLSRANAIESQTRRGPRLFGCLSATRRTSQFPNF